MKPSRSVRLMFPCAGNDHAVLFAAKTVLWIAVFLWAISALVARPAFGAGGQILWEEEFDRNGEGQGADRPNAIAAEGNRVYLAVGGIGYLVRAYNGKTGRLLWQDELPVVQFSSEARSIAVDKGRVYVAGCRRGTVSRQDLLVRAYDGRTGQLLWEDIADFAGLDDCAEKIVAHNGRVYVGGTVTTRQPRLGDAGNAPIIVRAYDAERGAFLWQDVYDATAQTQTRRVSSIAAEKGVVVVGTDWSDSGSVLRAYDSDTGILRWQDQKQDAGFLGLAVEKGRVYAAGSRREGNASFFWVSAYDRHSGALHWEDLHLLNGEFDNGAADIAIDRGRLFAAGYVMRSDLGPGITTEFIVRSYEAKTGGFIWQDRFHGLGNRTNVAFAVDTERNAVYAAGLIASAAHNTEFVVQAYEAKTGAPLWKDETARPGSDAALVVAAEKGRVYAAGYSNADTSGKLFIRAYDAR